MLRSIDLRIDIQCIKSREAVDERQMEMEIYRIIGKRQIMAAVLCAALALAIFAAATNGAAAVTVSNSERKLPIYSVGREEDDKQISLSFDAAWAAG